MIDIRQIILELHSLAPSLSYIAIFFIVFAESGLFFGFFLPGDSLLVTAGLLATQGYFSILFLMISLALAAIGGDSVGYWMGRKFGSRFFNPKHLKKASDFYKKHGGKAIVLARFVPIIRTFAPIAAGVAKMDYKRFLTFNIFGGLLWTWGMLLIGYFLGKTIPNVDHYLLPIIFAIVLVSILPALVEFIKNRKSKY